MAAINIYDETGVEFRSLQQTYNAVIQKTLMKYGLYPGQPQMLFAIQELKSPTQNELAEKLCVSKASAGVSLQRLSKAGFVKRIRDKKDTRCIRIALTEKGLEYARWCAIDYEMIYTTLLESFTGDERNRALSVLSQMNKSLSGLKERLSS